MALAVDEEGRRLDHAEVGAAGRHALDGISALQGRVLRDPALARDVMDAASRGGRVAFLDAAGFAALRGAIVPLLVSSHWPAVWIAECFDPALVIRLAVLLEEEGMLARTRVYVTGPNGALLADLSALRIDAGDLAACDREHLLGGGKRSLATYCIDAPGGLRLRPALTDNIVWWQHDIASDASFHEFQLIVCGRPLAEFQYSLRQKALALFGASLCAFGMLQIDAGGERLGALFERDFNVMPGGRDLYRRGA